MGIIPSDSHPSAGRPYPPGCRDVFFRYLVRSVSFQYYRDKGANKHAGSQRRQTGDFREPKMAQCLVAVGKPVVQEARGCIKP